jgi:hypothetical protein
MSEFNQQVEEMKESINKAIADSDTDNMFISSEVIQEDEDAPTVSTNELDSPMPSFQAPNQRNEKGHRKRKLKDRLDAVIADNRAKEFQLNQQLAYIQEQERRIAEAQAKAEQHAHYTNIYYEQSLDNEEQHVLSELELATDNGDTKKQVELQKRLADITAQKHTQQLSKTIQKKQTTYQEPDYTDNLSPPTYYPSSAPQQEINEHLEDFLEENPWADPNSSEYDSHLSAELNDLAVLINKNLRYNNAGNMIGRPEYYRSLSEEMRKRYSLGESTHYPEYVDNTPYEVAPVNRRGSSMADRYVSNNQNLNRSGHAQMALTPQQRNIAAKMAPTLSSIYKRTVTEEEAIADYYNRMSGRPSTLALRK